MMRSAVVHKDDRGDTNSTGRVSNTWVLLLSSLNERRDKLIKVRLQARGAAFGYRCFSNGREYLLSENLKSCLTRRKEPPQVIAIVVIARAGYWLAEKQGQVRFLSDYTRDEQTIKSSGTVVKTCKRVDRKTAHQMHSSPPHRHLLRSGERLHSSINIRVQEFQNTTNPNHPLARFRSSY